MVNTIYTAEEKSLRYWYDHTSMLSFARMIMEKLPLRLRLFTKIYVDEKWLDNRAEVIRVYCSYRHYATMSDERFCYEFTLDDLEEEANGRKCITSEKILSRKDK